MYIFLTVNKFQNIQFCHAIDRKTILPDTTDIIYPRDTSGKWKKKKKQQDRNLQRTFSTLVISFQLYNRAVVMVTAPAGCS